ncbi:DUF4135 domain-containing protein [Streptomyces sp. SID4931]|nr:DUF4135 domain-containing protein [Streptomyces sp. SID4931]
MNSHDVSPGTAEALRTYLPELTDPELIAHVEERLRAAATAHESEGEGGEQNPDLPEAPAAYDPSLDPDGLFHDYFRHFVAPGTGFVRHAAAQSPTIAAPRRIVDDFVVHQTGLVSRLMIRTLVEELHRRRTAGLLDGETPEERYAAFRRWTNSPQGHAELTGRYPHLFSAVGRQVEASARYVVEIIEELDVFAPRLSALVPGGGPEHLRVDRLVLGEGDTHNGGRSVAQVLFIDGARVLYKPHPIGAEAGYSSFVSWMNGRLGTDLPTVAVVPTGHGGFVEFIPTEEYAGEQKDYFARIGTLAGILFLLRATDIHFENMVSCAAGPVVIDTETLLSPRLEPPRGVRRRRGLEGRGAHAPGIDHRIGAAAARRALGRRRPRHGHRRDRLRHRAAIPVQVAEPPEPGTRRHVRRDGDHHHHGRQRQPRRAARHPADRQRPTGHHQARVRPGAAVRGGPPGRGRRRGRGVPRRCAVPARQSGDHLLHAVAAHGDPPARHG